MNKLATIRDNFREKYAWLLLPILFAICFIPSNRTGATNLYRLLIVLPMILCFRPSDLKLIWENTTARWFLVLCGWMTLTLVWDGLAYKDLKLFWRELNVLALFYLVYLVGRFHSERMPMIINSLLLFGVIGAFLILLDWSGVQYIYATWQHAESSRGVFHHHVLVGWVMAVLAIVALNCWLKARAPVQNILYLVTLVFFAGFVFLVQARGGYVVFCAGIGLLLLLSPGKKIMLLMLGGLLGLVLVWVLFQQELLTMVEKISGRGTASRLPIWQNGFDAIGESMTFLLFGHGLSAEADNQVGGGFIAEHYHNFFLNQGFYTGLIGLFLYLGLLVSLLKKVMARPDLWLWGAVLLAMQLGFMTDGDRLFVRPSATLLCVLLPMAFIIFNAPTGEKGPANWAEIRSLKHLGLFVAVGFALAFFIGVCLGLLQRPANKSLPDEVIFNEGDVLSAKVVRGSQNGRLIVDIEGWPASYGGKVAVQLTGVHLPWPWRYKCEEAATLWKKGQEYLDELIISSPMIELRNTKRSKAGNNFRLNADVYINQTRLADKLVEAGFAVYGRAEAPWCKGVE